MIHYRTDFGPNGFQGDGETDEAYAHRTGWVILPAESGQPVWMYARGGPRMIKRSRIREHICEEQDGVFVSVSYHEI